MSDQQTYGMHIVQLVDEYLAARDLLIATHPKHPTRTLRQEALNEATKAIAAAIDEVIREFHCDH